MQLKPLLGLSRLVAILMFLAQTSANATHIVGGEITYTCLGNDSFRIQVNVFRDCYNGVPPFDNPASLGVFDANWNLVTSRLMIYPGDDTLDVFLNDPCLQAPPNVCVHRTTYTIGLRLPYRQGGYRLVYQRCCRNLLIQNIFDPEATGASFVAEITEASLLLCNNSAVFRNWPPVAICINQPIDFDHGAVDPDGDSLVYRICTPNSGANEINPQPQPPFPGPYAPVIWVPPYSLANVLGGQPLTIDPKTGFLTGVPNTLGNFVVGICVEEYRNGQLISSTNRDFQYNVANCGLVAAAFQAPSFVCDTLGVQFINQSGQGGSYLWYFNWPNTNLSSTQKHPYVVFPGVGSYEVALIVNPNEPCSDTAIGRIELRQGFVEANFIAQPGLCNQNGIPYSVTNLAVDTAFGIQSVQWTLTGPGNPGQVSSWEPMFTLSTSGTYVLTMIAKSLNGCTDELSDTLVVQLAELTGFKAAVNLCIGQSAGLYPNAPPGQSYVWSPDTWLSNPNVGNPIVTPSSNIMYTVTVTQPVSGCTRVGTVQVNVSQSSTGDATADPSVVLPGQTSQLNYTGLNPLSVTWSPSGSLSAANIVNPIATITADSVTYTVIADYGGCFDTAQVTVYVRSIICEEPYVFIPTAFSPNGDMENDDLGVEGNFIEAMHFMIYDRWGEKVFESFSKTDRWDGTFGGRLLPPDTYGYHLEVECIGGDRFAKQGNITLLR